MVTHTSRLWAEATGARSTAPLLTGPSVRMILAILAIVGGLLGSVPQVAAQGPSPTAAPDVESRLPDRLGGVATQVSILRGAEHLASLDEDDPADAEVRAGLMSLLGSTGRSIEDVTSGYAVAASDDLVAFVVAIRVAGAPEGSLLPAYLPIVRRDLIDPREMPGRLGDHDVLIVTSSDEGGGPDVDLHVFVDGDTLWLLQGPTEVLEAAIIELE